MDGTKRIKWVRIVAMLLIIVAAVVLFVPAPGAVEKIELDPKDAEESYKYSFLEGIQFDLIHEEVMINLQGGKVSEKQYEKFLSLSKKVAEDFTHENIKGVYQYAAKLLKREVQYYYHEDVNPETFMGGFAVQSAEFAVSLYYEEGIISEARYNEIHQLYENLMMDPSSEGVDMFLLVVGDVLLQGIAAGEDILPPQQAYIGN